MARKPDRAYGGGDACSSSDKESPDSSAVHYDPLVYLWLSLWWVWVCYKPRLISILDSWVPYVLAVLLIFGHVAGVSVMETLVGTVIGLLVAALPELWKEGARNPDQTSESDDRGQSNRANLNQVTATQKPAEPAELEIKADD